MASPEEQLVFGPTLEGLFMRGLAGKLSPGLIQQLRALGLDLEKPLRPAYPRAVVNAAVTLTAKTLYPSVALDEAFYRVGQHVTSGLRATTLGAATLAIVRLVGPKRTLGRLARTFRSTNNYMNVTLRELTPTSWELDLEPSNDYPSYMQAVLEDMLNVAGAEQLKVEVAVHDKARALCTYRISWR
ncbi:MAG: DUF2378 family protein [Myxococcales bacterium]|nr:DUF2378 family protein [Myxococcales bacterium]